MGYFISSKTHRYIKIRVYPSDYLRNKYDINNPILNKKFRESFELYREFYEGLVEMITNKPYEYYRKHYMFGTMDATDEEIHEITGISIAEAEAFKIYCIPKTEENEVIFDYIIKNVKNKYKVLKRLGSGAYMEYGVSTFHRDMNKTSPEMLRRLQKI